MLTQSYPPDQIVVVDDGSTDDTAERVRSYAGRVDYLRRENRGVSAARNAGIERSRGEWIAFLDADDWYYPDRIRWHAEWIEAEPSLDFLTGDFDYVRSDGSHIRRSMESTVAGSMVLRRANGDTRAHLAPDEISPFIEAHFGDTHTLTVPRATLLSVGGYPVGVRVCEDVSLLIRLVACSRTVGVWCRPMAAYVIHEASATRSDPVRSQRETVAALFSLRTQLVDGAPAVRAGLHRALRRARLDLAYALLRRGGRAEALRAVAPLLATPSWTSIRDVVSVLLGLRGARDG